MQHTPIHKRNGNEFPRPRRTPFGKTTCQLVRFVLCHCFWVWPLFQVIEPINNEIQIISTSYYKQGFDISPSRTPIGKIVYGDWTPSHLAERQTNTFNHLTIRLPINRQIRRFQFSIPSESWVVTLPTPGNGRHTHIYGNGKVLILPLRLHTCCRTYTWTRSALTSGYNSAGLGAATPSLQWMRLCCSERGCLAEGRRPSHPALNKQHESCEG